VHLEQKREYISLGAFYGTVLKRDGFSFEALGIYFGEKMRGWSDGDHWCDF
jgi:hypothetical protein